MSYGMEGGLSRDAETAWTKVMVGCRPLIVELWDGREVV